MTELIDEWLGSQGYDVVRERPDVLLVDLPAPRERGDALIERLGTSYPGVPIVALSPAVLPCCEPSGTLARALGVSSVLPKPLSRDALIDAVRHAAAAAA